MSTTPLEQKRRILTARVRTAHAARGKETVPLGKQLRALRTALFLEERGLKRKAADALVKEGMEKEARELANRLNPTLSAESYEQIHIFRASGIDVTDKIEALAGKDVTGLFYAALLLTDNQIPDAIKNADTLSKRPQKRRAFGVISATGSTEYAQAALKRAPLPGEEITFCNVRSADENAAAIVNPIAYAQVEPLERIYNAFRIYLRVGFQEGIAWALDTLRSQENKEWYEKANRLLLLASDDTEKVSKLIGQITGTRKERYVIYAELVFEEAIVPTLSYRDHRLLLTTYESLKAELAGIEKTKLTYAKRLFGQERKQSIEQAEKWFRKIDFTYLTRIPTIKSKSATEVHYEEECAAIAFENKCPEAQHFAGKVYARNEKTSDKARICAQRLLQAGEWEKAESVFDALFVGLSQDERFILAREIEPLLRIVALEQYQVLSRDDFLRVAQKIVRNPRSFNELKRAAWMIAGEDKRTSIMNDALSKLREFGEIGQKEIATIMRDTAS